MGRGGAEEATAARCLDLTRLVSRVGRGPWTGIDRVEAAYLQALLARPEPLFALVRTQRRFTLLGRAGTQALSQRLMGTAPWGRPDLRARFARRAPPLRRAALADLRRLALAQSRHRGLAAMLARHLPPGTAWLNVGHTNLGRDVFAAFHALPGGRTSVFVHDMIPLDFPQFQRPGTVQIFETRMRAVARGADLVIYNSEQSRRDGERHFGRFGRVPPGLVAHLGVEVPEASKAAPAQAAALDAARPWFVTLGTIEPRKNHALLLDLWERLATELDDAEMPQLVIIGSRGWANEAVFARLDSSPLMGRHVHELSGLDDSAVAHLLSRAQGALFPTRAEGFGLPACEAAAMGVPVVASDLPVFHEVLADYAIYAEPDDLYSWHQIVMQLTKQAKDRAQNGPRLEPPTWEAHFNQVLRLT